jgi:hypothetical protein
VVPPRPYDRRAMTPPELSGRELLHECQRLMESVVERERRLQSDLAGYAFAPVDAVFDLLEESGTTLRKQAEALEAGGRALEETAALIKSQAELFEQTVGTLRQPAQLARAASGAKPRRRRRSDKSAS